MPDTGLTEDQRVLARLRVCRACGHDLLTQHDPEDETCDAFSGDIAMGVCPCGRSWVEQGGHRLSWVERAAAAERERRAQSELASILTDLDRCEHGRHEGDACTLTGGCGGASHGNPIAAAHDRVVGFNIGGRPYRIPERGHAHDVRAWSVEA